MERRGCVGAATSAVMTAWYSRGSSGSGYRIGDRGDVHVDAGGVRCAGRLDAAAAAAAAVLVLVSESALVLVCFSA
eukprot:6182826-Pleurochrysis_carterae.AAC.2